MALIVNEEAFIRGGGHSPADCVLYGNFTGSAGETEITIAPGNVANTVNQTGSKAMRQLRGITFTLQGPGAVSTYPSAIKSFDSALQTDKYVVTMPANRVWSYKLEGVDNGLAPVIS